MTPKPENLKTHAKNTKCVMGLRNYLFTFCLFGYSDENAKVGSNLCKTPKKSSKYFKNSAKVWQFYSNFAKCGYTADVCI